MTTFYLDIYTWSGLSLDATHYYGELYTRDEKYNRTEYGNKWHGRELYGKRIIKELTSKEAKAINKKYREMYNEETYNLYKVTKGELNFSFETKEDVIARAIEIFEEEAVSGDILVDADDRNKIYHKKV